MLEHLKPPSYPVTFIYPGVGHTGNVWHWIFWWCRNGLAFVQKCSSIKERKKLEKIRHSIIEEIKIECWILPGQ